MTQDVSLIQILGLLATLACDQSILNYLGKAQSNIHLLGSNLHVLWFCLTYTVRFESIVLFIHILSTHNLLFLNIFLTPPPFVSNGQHSTYPPSPPRQQWSAFGLPPLPPSSAMVSICHTPSHPSGG